MAFQTIFQQVQTYAPATIGFTHLHDSLACAIDGMGNSVSLKMDRSILPGDVRVEERGKENSTDMDVVRQAATKTMAMLKVDPIGLSFEVERGIPLNSGLGSTAATAAAAALAVNHMFGGELGARHIYYIMENTMGIGKFSHANLAASLLGSFVYLKKVVFEREDVILNRVKIPFKREHVILNRVKIPFNLPLFLILVRHEEGISNQKVLLHALGRWETITNKEYHGVEHRAEMMATLAEEGNFQKFGELMWEEEILDPWFGEQVPGFQEAKSAAMDAGALGFQLCGTSTSMVAITDDEGKVNLIRSGMESALGKRGVITYGEVKKLDKMGARLIALSR